MFCFALPTPKTSCSRKVRPNPSLVQTRGVQAIYDFVSLFFAGAMVPLWFFPPLLRQVADWLPSQAQAFIPLSLYMGQAPPQGVAGALGVQLAWVAALFGIAWLVWQRATWAGEPIVRTIEPKLIVGESTGPVRV